MATTDRRCPSGKAMHRTRLDALQECLNGGAWRVYFHKLCRSYHVTGRV